MEVPKPVGCSSRDLSLQGLLDYFKNYQSYPVYKYPAVRQEGGELFLYLLPLDNKGMPVNLKKKIATMKRQFI